MTDHPTQEALQVAATATLVEGTGTEISTANPEDRELKEKRDRARKDESHTTK